MGFGLLFIGYFLTVMNIPIFGIYGTLIRLCGLIIMMISVFKLRKYNRAFDLTAVGIGLMTVVTLILLAVNIDSKFIVQKEVFSTGLKNAISYSDQVISFIFSAFLLYAVFKIAKETEAKKVSTGAIRNFIFICVYYVVYIVKAIPTKGIQSVQNEFSIILWVLYFVNIALNLLVIFSAYANICDESDIEMTEKTYSIPIISRLQEETDRRAQKAREADEFYRREKKLKREEKRKNKKRR